MSKGIRISEKHGVNPSLGVCWLCGDDDGTILLFGALPGDTKAPHHVCIGSSALCKRCDEALKIGVAFIEVVEEQEMTNPTRTGRFTVVKEEGVKKTIRPPELVQNLLTCRRTYVPRSVYSKMFREVVHEMPERN